MRTKHITDGKNSQLVPNNVTFRLGEYTTLPAANATRKNHLAVQTGSVWFCNGTAWSALGLSLIDSDSFSAVASHSTGSVFSADYTSYLVLIGPYTSSAAATLNVRLRTGGADNSTGNNYYYSWGSASTASAVAATGNTAQNAWPLILTGSAITDAHLAITFTNPFAADQTTYSYHGAMRWATDCYALFGGGMHNAATSYDALSLIPASGTITGTIKIFGIRG
jgi:hypothetical protein